MNILGIDPGLKGALVLIGDGEHIINSATMPVLGKRVDEGELVKLLRKACGSADAVALEEMVPFIPNRATTFRLGLAQGFIQGVLVTLEARYMLVKPKDWQKSIPHQKATGRALKGVWIAEALRRCPDLYQGQKHTMEHRSAIADAYLLAVYRRRQLIKEGN